MTSGPAGRQDGIEVVLVGHRPGALQAVSRLRLRTLLVDDREPTAAARRRIAGWARVAADAGCEAVVEAVRQALGAGRPARVVASGERGVLAAAALRAAFGLPGVDRETARRARDKADMKQAARAAGVPCADWEALHAGTDPAGLVERLGLPLVIKHRLGAGSRGLVVAHTPEEARAVLEGLPPQERDAWMAERMIRGVEMSVESFVQDGEILFTNPTEYLVPAFANIAPAVLPDDVHDAVLDLNARALEALGIRRGMTHLELFLTDAGPLFGEVAVRPPGGRIMRLLRRAYHFDPWEAVLRIEGGERPDFPDRAIEASGVWMLHPGEGRVRSVRGLAAARRVRGVRKLVCRVRAGQEVPRRESTGADVGWIEVRGANRHQVAERLREAHDLLRIDMEEDPAAAGAGRGPSTGPGAR